MSKRKLYALLAPTITFFIGIIFQMLVAQWFISKDVITFTSIIIIVSLVFIFTAALTIQNSIDMKFATVDSLLKDIIMRTGLRVEYIPDGLNGASYLRSTQLIRDAEESLLFLGLWEPFEKYEVGNCAVKDARRMFYQAVREKVDAHLGDKQAFHTRIVQIPKEYAGKPLPFHIDEVFFEYLKHVAENQEKYPLSCLLKKTVAQINAHFTIIDDRYIIMPILTHIKNELQRRHGVLIFDDTQGELVKSLKRIYKTLEPKAQAINSSELAS